MLINVQNYFLVDALTCFCLGHCPDFLNDPLKNGTCEAESGGSCFKAVEEVYDPDTNNYVPEYTYGCLREEGKFFFATKNIHCEKRFTKWDHHHVFLHSGRINLPDFGN